MWFPYEPAYFWHTLLSSQTCTSESYFIANFICEKLESLRSKTNKKLQGRTILLLEKLLYFIYHNNKTTIKGIKIQVKGRINGVARSKKAVISCGTLSLQQIDSKIDFLYQQVLTVFGCFGIKIWVRYV